MGFFPEKNVRHRKERRIRIAPGIYVRLVTQPHESVQQVLDRNDYIRNNASRAGGFGSYDNRYLLSTPEGLVRKWHKAWVDGGMHKGTGKTFHEWRQYMASKPGYERLIVTPSGRLGTPIEKEARRQTFTSIGRRNDNLRNPQK